MDGNHNGGVIHAETLVYILGSKEAELFMLKRVLADRDARIAELEAAQASSAAVPPADQPQDSGAGKTASA